LDKGQNEGWQQAKKTKLAPKASQGPRKEGKGNPNPNPNSSGQGTPSQAPQKTSGNSFNVLGNLGEEEVQEETTSKKPQR